MTYLRRTVGVVFGLAFFCCLVACGGVVQKAKQAAEDSIELDTLSRSYHAFYDEKKVGPADADEWLKWAQAKPDQSAAVTHIPKTKAGGKYKFYWKVDFAKLPAGAEKVILGHDAKLPASEGVVITCDGAAQFMQPAQFNGLVKPN